MEEKVLSYEEKMALANRMRSSNRFAPVSESEFVSFDVSEECIEVATSAGKTEVYIVSPNDVKSYAPVVINLHGGGFINKRLDRDKLFCYKLADVLKCKVIDVDYKLSPEHVFPVAYKECVDLVKWVYDRAEILEINPEQISIVGHSAGGNLAIGSIIENLEGNMVDKVAIEYAPLDLYTDPAEKPRFERDLPPERARAYNQFYCAAKELKDPRVSPIFLEKNELKGFPKTLVMTAGEDKLCAEGESFANNLQDAGVDVTYKNFLGCVHGFTINRMDKYEESFKLITSFLSYEMK